MTHQKEVDVLDLLDELDETLGNKSGSRGKQTDSSVGRSSSRPPSANPRSGGVDEDDIDSLLSYIKNPTAPQPNQRSKVETSSATPFIKPSCFPTSSDEPRSDRAKPSVFPSAFPSSSETPTTHTKPAFIPAASPFSDSGDSYETPMQCTKCDFKVLVFNGEWAADADYMFFRNFMPNVQKISTKLKKVEGMKAYACQCTWCSVESWSRIPVTHWPAIRKCID